MHTPHGPLSLLLSRAFVSTYNVTEHSSGGGFRPHRQKEEEMQIRHFAQGSVCHTWLGKGLITYIRCNRDRQIAPCSHAET